MFVPSASVVFAVLFVAVTTHVADFVPGNRTVVVAIKQGKLLSCPLLDFFENQFAVIIQIEAEENPIGHCAGASSPSRISLPLFDYNDHLGLCYYIITVRVGS